MTERIKKMRACIKNKEHHTYRKNLNLSWAEEYREKNLSPVERSAENLVRLLDLENPVILEHEKIILTRTKKNVPFQFTNKEWEEKKNVHCIHESGHLSNICPDYASVIKTRLAAQKAEIAKNLLLYKKKGAHDQEIFLASMIKTIDAVLAFAVKYQMAAQKAGNKETANALENIPSQGAKTFYEALQFFRILHLCLWLSGNYHMTIGRLDQYMYPYYIADIESGRLNKQGAVELIEEFFLTFNKDSDLYPGVQQGDNGQSLVLGGLDSKGNDTYNDLSELCLMASLELGLIDPKINLRVHKNTVIEIYELGTELTRQGLGFPQYSNDDIVIPGLEAKGYTHEDASDYAVAACWEFIIPGKGMDIPNIAALHFPKIMHETAVKNLASSETFNDFYEKYKHNLNNEIKKIISSLSNLYIIPAPFLSVLMHGCLEKTRDVSEGCLYNNYGIHGVGLACAADSLAAIKKHIFETRDINAEDLEKALEKNFEGYDNIFRLIRFESPKMGMDDDYVDFLACDLIDFFATELDKYKNERNGIFRAGTGTAMFYLADAKAGATPDGRKEGENFGANFSPGLHTRPRGPVSVIHSFSKPHLVRAVNGGPLTLEFHSSLFRNPESISKVAMFVKSYVDMGGATVTAQCSEQEYAA